jgi:hypothetical protein
MTLQVWRGRAVATSAFTDLQKPTRRCCHRVVTLSQATRIGSSARRSRGISAQASHGQLLPSSSNNPGQRLGFLPASVQAHAEFVEAQGGGRVCNNTTSERRHGGGPVVGSRLADALQREDGEHPLGCDTSTRATWHVTRCSVHAHGQCCLHEHLSRFKKTLGHQGLACTDPSNTSSGVSTRAGMSPHQKKVRDHLERSFVASNRDDVDALHGKGLRTRKSHTRASTSARHARAREPPPPAFPLRTSHTHSAKCAFPCVLPWTLQGGQCSCGSSPAIDTELVFFFLNMAS